MKDFFMIVEKPKTQQKSAPLFQVQSKSLFVGAEEALYGRHAAENAKEGEEDPLTVCFYYFYQIYISFCIFCKIRIHLCTEFAIESKIFCSNIKIPNYTVV